MAILTLSLQDNFADLRTKFNSLSNNFGDLALLTTVPNTSVVAALNGFDSNFNAFLDSANALYTQFTLSVDSNFNAYIDSANALYAAFTTAIESDYTAFTTGIESDFTAFVNENNPTLDDVTTAGSSTTNLITVGGIVTSGSISAGSVASTGFLTADSATIANNLTTGGLTTTGIIDVSGGTLTLANDQISGDKIDGGTISTFASTGIDDNATTTVVTISDSDKVGVGTVTPAKALHVVGGFEIEGEIVEEVYTLSGTTPALDPANGTIQTWTLTGSSTPTDSLEDGESMTLLIDDGTAYTITWPTMEWIGGSAPTLDTTNTTVVILWKTGSSLYGSSPGVLS